MRNCPRPRWSRQAQTALRLAAALLGDDSRVARTIPPVHVGGRDGDQIRIDAIASAARPAHAALRRTAVISYFSAHLMTRRRPIAAQDLEEPPRTQ